MVTTYAQQNVGDLVRSQIDRSRVFERFGIDYCCHGDRTLAEVCVDGGLDIDQIVRELDQLELSADGSERVDWSKATLSALIEHIISCHHDYLRGELPRLAKLISRLVDVHGDKAPALGELQEVFASLESELNPHMMKEEQVLFPIIRQIEAASAQGTSLPSFHCGSVNNPIGAMRHEHEIVGEALSRMRSLTNDYAPPEDACQTYTAMLAGLAQLERDLHLHIHKENNILFPAAVRLEAALTQTP